MSWLTESRESLSTVFGNAGLRRVSVAFGGSTIGDWAYATAVTVWAYGVGGATAVGVWATVRYLLLAMITPFAAVLADRFPRRMVMIASDLIRAVLIAAAAALVYWHAAAAATFVVATAASVAGAAFRPSLSALLPSLSRSPNELTAANGVLSTLESVAIFVGPAIGGGLLAITNVPVVFLVNVLSFLCSAALLVGVPAPAAAPADAVPVVEPAGVAAVQSSAVGDDEPAGKPAGEIDAGFWVEAMAGFRAIWASSDLRLVVALMGAQTVVAGASAVFTIALADHFAALGPRGVGYLDAIMGVGAILGGGIAIARASRQKLATDFGLGVVLWSLPLVLIVLWPRLAVVFAVMFVLGVGNPLVDVNAFTILQRLTPDAVLGRVMGAVEAALIGGMAIGALIMPFVIRAGGVAVAVAVVGGAVALVALLSVTRLRRLDETLREPSAVPLLRGLAVFAPLRPAVLEQLARRLTRLEVSPGREIITEGAEGDRFYVIDSGRVRATFAGRMLSESGPGEAFGEIALLRNVPRTATVTALEPTTLWALGRDEFLAAMTENSEARLNAETLAARRIPTT